MNRAQEYLVKSALRLGTRVRLGLLSPSALRTLQAQRVLRTPARMSRGLQRGNVNLMKQYGIADRSREHFPKPAPRGDMIPTAALDMDTLKKTMLRQTPKAMHPEILRELANEKKPHSLLLQPWGVFRKNPVDVSGNYWYPNVSQRSKRELKALIRRHEIDEIRVRLNPKLFNKRFRRNWHHTGPAVLQREGMNVTGLSPETQNFARLMRLQELSGRAKGIRVGGYTPAAMREFQNSSYAAKVLRTSRNKAMRQAAQLSEQRRRTGGTTPTKKTVTLPGW